jgi:hypothetical protein
MLRTAFWVLVCVLLIDKSSIMAFDCSEKQIKEIQQNPPTSPKDPNKFLLPPDQDIPDPDYVPPVDDDNQDDGDSMMA